MNPDEAQLFALGATKIDSSDPPLTIVLTAPYHPPSLNQALDFLKDKLDCNGNPIKIALEMKGGRWTQAKVTRLADVLKTRGSACSATG